MRSRHVFISLSLLLVLSESAAAQSNVIKGKVRSASGVSLNNAIVELKGASGAMIGQTVTRNDGDFAFSGLEAGEYEVAVTLSGYEPSAELVRFKLPPGMHTVEVLSVEILLKPKAEVFLGPPGVNFAQDVPKSAREAYEKGMSKLREGKRAEGVPLLREAIQIFNDYFAAHFALGVELYRSRQFDEALQALEGARRINDRESAVYHMFGLVMIEQQKFGVAEYGFREAVRLNGNNVASRFYHGVVLVEIGVRGSDPKQAAADLTEAEKELKWAYDLSGKRLSGVHLQLHRIHLARQDNEAAARDLENFLKAEPNAKNAAQIRAAIKKLREKTGD